MVPSSTRQANYTGNGSTTTYAIPFPFQQNGDIVVTQTVGGVTTTLTQGTAYNVYGAGQPSGGSVVFVGAPANGVGLNISRTVSLTQGTSYRNQGSYFPATIENGLDKVTMGLQQLNDAVAAIQQGNPSPPPPPTPLVNYVAAINALGSSVNAKNDGKTVSNAHIGAGSFTVTSASNPFTSTAVDAGKAIQILLDNGNLFNSTIATVTNTGTAVLNNSAPTAATANACVFGTDNTAAVQAAINAASSNNGGSGQLRLYFPAGLYVFAGQVVFNLVYLNVSIEGDGWLNTTLAHIQPAGAGNKGALYFSCNTDTSGGITGSKPNGWYDVHDISFGSTGGCGAYLACAIGNSRIRDCYIYSAGAGTNTDSGDNNAFLYLNMTQGGAGEFHNLRLGSSNMGIENVFSWWGGLVYTQPPNGILGLSRTTNEVVEQKFSEIQVDGAVTSHMIRFESMSTLASAPFGLQFHNVTSKVPGSSGFASFYFDGCSAELTGCLCEQVTNGQPFIIVKSTFASSGIYASDCLSYSGNVYVDESAGNFGSVLRLHNCLFWKADRLNAGAGGTSYVEVNGCDYRSALGAGLYYGQNNRFDTNGLGNFVLDDSPQLIIGSVGLAAGVNLPAHSAVAGGSSYLQLFRYRGSVAVPAAVQAGDILGQVAYGGYNGSTLKAVVATNGVALAVNGANIQGQYQVLTQDVNGNQQNTLKVDTLNGLTMASNCGLNIGSHVDTTGTPGNATVTGYVGKCAVANGASTITLTLSAIGPTSNHLVIFVPLHGGGDSAAPTIVDVTIGNNGTNGTAQLNLSGVTNGTKYFMWFVVG